jgi:anaerobic magnesium-protoporphyrin IX monomethyl ester cyclase
MLNVKSFEALCQGIIDAGLDNLEYFVQAMTSSIANHGETLGPLMKRAGFRYVFLGIENILETDLEFLRASSKNTARDYGRSSGNATLRAINFLHRNRMLVVGGLIVGNPSDTRESIEANLEFARRYVDWPYIQHPTTYPGTPMANDFRGQGLIENEQIEEHDGTTAVVRTLHLSSDEVEFLRWKAERWMKVRHIPAVLRHDPRSSSRMHVACWPTHFAGAQFDHCWDLKISEKPSHDIKRCAEQSGNFFERLHPAGI